MLDALFHFVATYGLTGFLLVVLFLIIQDPDRAVKLKAIFLKPLFDFFRWGSKQYIASEVAYSATHFLNTHVSRLVPSIPKTKIRIKWVTSPLDPVLSQDGSLILRLTETNDQTRNILAAVRVALPRVVCPTLRLNVESYATCAIDLALLRTLVERLGKHAQPVFQRYFYGPETEQDPRVAHLFQQLVLLDNAGVFVTVFLEELNLLGESIFSSGDGEDKTEAIVAFAVYLLNLAKREIGQKIDLEYISKDFKVGIILLAISWKAQTEGLPPYIRRIGKLIRLGCDSLYVISFPNARDFLARIVSALETEARLVLAKQVPIAPSPSKERPRPGISQLALYRRNSLFDHSTFHEAVAELSLEEGACLQATAVDVSPDAALFEVGGLFGVLTKSEASWHTVTDCREFIQVGTSYTCLLKSIDVQREQLMLSLRSDETDPWKKAPLPHKGDVLDVRVTSVHAGALICQSESGLEIQVPLNELSWFADSPVNVDALIATRIRVLVYDTSVKQHIIRASVRRLSSDPWPEIQKALPKGTLLRATVLQVTPDCVKVELPNGLVGSIPREALLAAGHELADYQNSVVPGQGLDVVVSKVFSGKRRIRLDLARNIQGK